MRRETLYKIAINAALCLLIGMQVAFAKEPSDSVARGVRDIATFAAAQQTRCFLMRSPRDARIILTKACHDPIWTVSMTTMIVVPGSSELCPLYIRGVHAENLRYECANGAEATDSSVAIAGVEAVLGTADWLEEIKRLRRNR